MTTMRLTGYADLFGVNPGKTIKSLAENYFNDFNPLLIAV